jgi:hypothetical protein
MQKQRFSLIQASNIKYQTEASPSKRNLLGPFSSPWPLPVPVLLSLASSEHLL